jgi:multidrug efflux pump subunit AcrA (membrane-fusion protein)
MKRTLKYSTAIVLAARLSTTFFLVSKGRTSPPGAVAEADAEPTSVVAAPGRVEPILEEIKVSSEIRGKIESAPVEADRAKAEADVALARAQLDEARARLEKASGLTDKPATAPAP